MLNHILLATDGSAAAERAADYAGALAQRFGAAVTVLYAYPRMPRNLGEPHITQLLNHTLEEAQSILERSAQRLRLAGVDQVSTDALEGAPIDTILEAVRSRKPDLLVLGARGMGAWQGILLGSVSMAVTQRAESPVLVVK